jgi:hypothetical protein
MPSGYYPKPTASAEGPWPLRPYPKIKPRSGPRPVAEFQRHAPACRFGRPTPPDAASSVPEPRTGHIRPVPGLHLLISFSKKTKTPNIS